VRHPPLILIVDDNADNREILEARLTSQGYATATASDGEEALAVARELLPDLILLDVMMPKLDGLEVCRQLRTDPTYPFVPIILVTARTALQDIVAGLDAGADEYLTKPVEQAALVARVRSILRAKALHDRVQEQARHLEAQATQLAEWNTMLERRVAEQVAEIERANRLRRFLAPQVADLIVSTGGERLLASHRRQVTLVFCDLRGFTAFAERAGPEEVMSVLHEYHAALGTLVHRFEGTLERFVGDGLVVLFNAPVPCADPSARAVRMAVGMRKAVGDLTPAWKRRGFELGFGIGIAHGEATVGPIGFEGRNDYAAIGGVANLAARLCSEARNGQILVSRPVADAVENIAAVEALTPVAMKGFQTAVPVYTVLTLQG
jgi:class 3 adenylate cyclase/CheY-like chemotaxis protein